MVVPADVAVMGGEVAPEASEGKGEAWERSCSQTAHCAVEVVVAVAEVDMVGLARVVMGE